MNEAAKYDIVLTRSDSMIKETTNYIYMGEEKNKKAFMHYTIEDSLMIIDETVVDESLQNQGVAGKLLTYAVNYAKKNNLKIKPECSYVKHKFSSSDKYDDIWYKN